MHSGRFLDSACIRLGPTHEHIHNTKERKVFFFIIFFPLRVILAYFQPRVLCRTGRSAETPLERSTQLDLHKPPNARRSVPSTGTGGAWRGGDTSTDNRCAIDGDGKSCQDRQPAPDSRGCGNQGNEEKSTAGEEQRKAQGDAACRGSP